VDTKKVGGDGGGRCWNSLLGGERSSNPLAREISITLHRQGGKRKPRSLRGSGRSCILGGGGAWGWWLRPTLATTWPQHGPTRPQHGLNTAQHAKRRIGFFAQNFLAKLQKKLSLMFRHTLLVCCLGEVLFHFASDGDESLHFNIFPLHNCGFLLFI
jgi:hypothetical protein